MEDVHGIDGMIESLKSMNVQYANWFIVILKGTGLLLQQPVINIFPVRNHHKVLFKATQSITTNLTL